MAALMRGEIELLLCCCRTGMTDAGSERIRSLLREDLDWTYLTWVARWHRVMPLLYRSLSRVCPEAVPEAILDRLQHDFSSNTLHNVLLTKELLGLLHLFKTQRIAAVPFKGPVLAVSVYGDLALRQFGDLDILVHAQDVLRAKALLIDRGYQAVLSAESQWRDVELTGAQEAAHLRFAHAYVFVRTDGKAEVDLHWTFTRRYFSFPLDLRDLQKRLEPVSLTDTVVSHFSPEDVMLILCVHGSKSLWQRLQWICDVAELVGARGHEMDWQQMIARAERLGSARMLWLGLQLASGLLDTTLPEAVWHRIQADPVAKALALQMQKRLFTDTGEPDDSAVEKFMLYFRMRERWRDKMRYLTLTPNAKDLMFLTLPAPLAFLYYGLRPIRLMREYGPSIWHRLRSAIR